MVGALGAAEIVGGHVTLIVSLFPGKIFENLPSDYSGNSSDADYGRRMPVETHFSRRRRCFTKGVHESGG